MTTQEFHRTLDEFNKGEVTFNQGAKWCFLHNGRWYPIHAFVARWHETNAIAGDSPTLHASVFLLSKLFPIACVQKTFTDYFPVEA